MTATSQKTVTEASSPVSVVSKEGGVPASSEDTKVEKASAEKTVNKSNTETQATAPQAPVSDSEKKPEVTPLPNISLGPSTVSKEAQNLSIKEVRVQQEALPPLHHQDTLPPSRAALPRDVTPPAGGLAPITPQDPREGTL